MDTLNKCFTLIYLRTWSAFVIPINWHVFDLIVHFRSRAPSLYSAELREFWIFWSFGQITIITVEEIVGCESCFQPKKSWKFISWLFYIPALMINLKPHNCIVVCRRRSVAPCWVRSRHRVESRTRKFKNWNSSHNRPRRNKLASIMPSNHVHKRCKRWIFFFPENCMIWLSTEVNKSHLYRETIQVLVCKQWGPPIRHRAARSSFVGILILFPLMMMTQGLFVRDARESSSRVRGRSSKSIWASAQMIDGRSVESENPDQLRVKMSPDGGVTRSYFGVNRCWQERKCWLLIVDTRWMVRSEVLERIARLVRARRRREDLGRSRNVIKRYH